MLGRYLTGQIIGQLFGQAAGGVLGDWFGWRNVFFVLAGMFALATAGLIFELVNNPRTRAATRTAGPPRFVADYVAVLSNPWARFVIFAVFIELSVAWGAFAYVGADLQATLRAELRGGRTDRWRLRHRRPDLCGIGTATGEPAGTAWHRAVRRRAAGVRLRPPGGRLCLVDCATRRTIAIGLGFYALHNTLQTNATQMTPEARGTAVAIFSSAIYLGQVLGVAVGGFVFDHYGAVPLFLGSGVMLLALACWFARSLTHRA